MRYFTYHKTDMTRYSLRLGLTASAWLLTTSTHSRAVLTPNYKQSSPEASGGAGQACAPPQGSAQSGRGGPAWLRPLLPGSSAHPANRHRPMWGPRHPQVQVPGAQPRHILNTVKNILPSGGFWKLLTKGEARGMVPIPTLPLGPGQGPDHQPWSPSLPRAARLLRWSGVLGGDKGSPHVLLTAWKSGAKPGPPQPRGFEKPNQDEEGCGWFSASDTHTDHKGLHSPSREERAGALRHWRGPVE